MANFVSKLDRIVPKKEQQLYAYVQERSKKVAQEIANLVTQSSPDEGGIVVVTGPLYSGKTSTAMRVCKHLKNMRLVRAQPHLDRADILNKHLYSWDGKKIEARSFATVDDVKKMFDEAEVMLIDEIMFVPYEMQSFLIYEIKKFIERGGWFIGFGILYNGFGGEFLICSHLRCVADKDYRLASTCQKCGRENASIGQRFVDGKPAHVGDPELLPPSETVHYEPRCKECFVVFS